MEVVANFVLVIWGHVRSCERTSRIIKGFAYLYSPLCFQTILPLVTISFMLNSVFVYYKMYYNFSSRYPILTFCFVLKSNHNCLSNFETLYDHMVQHFKTVKIQIYFNKFLKIYLPKGQARQRAPTWPSLPYNCNISRSIYHDSHWGLKFSPTMLQC
jgi:hypothetical protein